MRFQRCSDSSFVLTTGSADETFAAGRITGGHLCPGMLLLLKGSLGMGKTKFVQGIGDALGLHGVKSPTFIIMREYNGNTPFLHADLYRIEDKNEADSLGIEEYLDDGFAAAVEWAERWETPPSEKRIDIEFSGSGDERLLVFTMNGCKIREEFTALADDLKSIALTEE